MDGLPALELWDLIVSVLGNVSRVSDRSVKPESDDHKHHKSHNKIDVTKDIDVVPSNVQSARQEALLYVFEDNEAVIKMIIKGRSPTMRHVSRTHRVALDWLLDRINLDSKIQIKYIDTKNQLADILTKENFTRDEWNHLLTFFNISHFSSTACIAAIGKTSSTRIRRRTYHSQITTHDDFYRKNAFGRVFFNFIKPAEDPRMDIKILENLLQVTIDRGNLRNRHHQVFQKRIMVDLGLLKSGKVELWNTIDRSGKPETISWDIAKS